jgi:hypothetical protein
MNWSYEAPSLLRVRIAEGSILERQAFPVGKYALIVTESSYMSFSRPLALGSFISHRLGDIERLRG